MIRALDLARRAGAALAVVAFGAGVAVASAPAAQAASPEILVSDDGVHFAPTLTSGLLDGLGLLTPGESIAASVWVRNPSTTDGSLRLSVDDFVGGSDAFTQNVTITADLGAYSWTFSLDQLTECGTVIPSFPIDAGVTLRIDVTAALDEGVMGQEAQNESVPVGLEVAVRDARNPFPTVRCEQPGPDPEFPDDGDDGNNGNGGNNGNETGGGTGGLSGTGADVLPTIGMSFVLLAIGFILVVVRRRRQEEERA